MTANHGYVPFSVWKSNADLGANLYSVGIILIGVFCLCLLKRICFKNQLQLKKQLLQRLSTLGLSYMTDRTCQAVGQPTCAAMTTPIGVHICARSSAPDPHKNTEKLRRASFSHLPHLIRRRRALRLIAHGFCFDFPLTPVGKSSKFAFNFLSVIMRDRSNLVAVRNVEFYHSKINSLFF